ncbi:MAG: prepilin peptidase [Acidimicrobiales bacterium]|jgi:leader peptidase (prepilin peptidase) / N-methyltransferase
MSATVEAVAGVFGLVIGSFVGVVVDRVPRKESIVSPPSHCVACAAPIRAYDNIPVVSYALLRGRCRACGAHIPPRDAILEVGTGALFVLLAWRLASAWELPAFCLLAASFVAISAIDVEHMRIPSPIVYATAGIGAPLLVLASAGTHDWTALLSALIGGAAAFAAFFALFFAVPKGIGFGDVRLAGLCGAFLGWFGYRYVVVGFLVGFIVAGVPAVVLLAMGKVQRRTQIPFGPFLAAGTIITVLVGPPLVHAWASI